MYSNCEMQDLLVRMAAIERRSAASTSVSSTDTPMLTFVALVLAAVSHSVLLCNTLPIPLTNQYYIIAHSSATPSSDRLQIFTLANLSSGGIVWFADVSTGTFTRSQSFQLY